VLRFDFTGLGESEGEFAATTFSSNVDDLVAAAGYLERHHQAPPLLIGHSLGGAAVLQAAARIPSARAVAVIGAPAEPTHLARSLGSARERIQRQGEAEVELAGKTVRLRKEFLEDLETHRMEATIRGLHRPLLILHAPQDEVVGIDNAGQIFQAARHPKSFISLDAADHLLSRNADARYAGAVIAAWAERYLDLATERREAGAPADNPVTVRTGRNGYVTDIRVNRHSLTADEPAAAGGQDRGPSPYDLLIAALGACTTMTLRMYADRKQIPLEAVVVRLRHEKIHAADCRDCDTREGRIDRIERDIELQGDLDAKTRQRMREIADKCPVHRTLQGEIVVDTRLREEGS
jgi:putative redox protein